MRTSEELDPNRSSMSTRARGVRPEPILHVDSGVWVQRLSTTLARCIENWLVHRGTSTSQRSDRAAQARCSGPEPHRSESAADIVDGAKPVAGMAAGGGPDSGLVKPC